MKRRSKHIASHRPWPCAILAIDPGEKSSGWALSHEGRLLDSGTCDPFMDARRIATDAFRTLDPEGEGELCPPLRVVLESWTSGPRTRDPRMSAARIQGLGAAAGAWIAACRSLRVPKAHVLRVNVARWRAAVTRPRFGTTTQQHHALELQAAQAFLECATPLPHDEAAAICIAKWASHAGEVGRTLPKKVRIAYGLEAA